jgi:hypothetical protein
MAKEPTTTQKVGEKEEKQEEQNQKADRRGRCIETILT